MYELLPVDVTEVLWTKTTSSGTEEPLSDNGSYGNLSHPSFEITSVRNYDAGIYECKSRAVTGHRMYAFNVTVIGGKLEHRRNS